MSRSDDANFGHDPLKKKIPFSLSFFPPASQMEEISEQNFEKWKNVIIKMGAGGRGLGS